MPSRPPHLKNALVRMCSGLVYTIWVLRADQYAIIRDDDGAHKIFESAPWRKMMESFPAYGIGDASMTAEERGQLDDWCRAMLSGKEYSAPFSKE